MYETGDRRPIAARNLAPIRHIAAWLIAHRASPDAISIGGMAAALIAGAAFAGTAYAPTHATLLFLAAAALVQARLLANLFDGMVAVGRGTASPIGELYNEVPDRISDTAVLAGLGVAAGQPALGMAAALAAISTAYVRAVGRALSGNSDFRGPMAKQQRMALATAAALWAALVPASWAAALPIGVPAAVLWIIAVLSIATSARRLAGTAQALRPLSGRP